MNSFLPITREEMQQRGWEKVDFVYVCGDAYVDHPSFGPAIISRVCCRIPGNDGDRDILCGRILRKRKGTGYDIFHHSIFADF